MSRPLELLAIGLGAITLCLPAAAAPQPISDAVREIELPPEKRQRRIFEELLGFDRWHRLSRARFEIALHESGVSPRLSDVPDRQEEVEEILASSLLRFLHKRVQGELRLIERRDALRRRLRSPEAGDARAEDDRVGIDFSPQLRVGERSSFGARLRLDGLSSRFWSGASLRLTRDLSGRDVSVKVAFRNHQTSSYIAYHSDHEKRGELIELGIRLSFR